jgi:hypothetical protein
LLAAPVAEAQNAIARVRFGPCKDDPGVKLKVDVTIASLEQQLIAYGTTNPAGELVLTLQDVKLGEQLVVSFLGNRSGEWHDCRSWIANNGKDGIEDYVMVMSAGLGDNCDNQRTRAGSYYVCNVEVFLDDGESWNLIETNDL